MIAFVAASAAKLVPIANAKQWIIQILGLFFALCDLVLSGKRFALDQTHQLVTCHRLADGRLGKGRLIVGMMQAEGLIKTGFGIGIRQQG